MKQIYYFIAALLFCVASVSAQVRVGNNTDPHEGAILDLQSTETADMGVLFPRVTLTSLDAFAPVAGDAIEGMVVYNDNETLGKGIYVWDGEQWKMAEDNCTVPKTSISSNIAPQNVVAGSSVTLTASVTNKTEMFEYQWYKNNIPISGATESSYTITSAVLDDYYACEVTDACGSGASGWSTHGAYKSSTEWLPFMPHNLGADTSKAWDTFSTDITGDYYQWGNAAPSGTYADIIGAWDVNNYETADAWLNNPCPVGWRVPTYIEWARVVAHNTWNNTGTWSDGDSGGKLIGDRLYLPAAGSRNSSNGRLYRVGEVGYYWSSTYFNESAVGGYCLFFNSNASAPTNSTVRWFGISVRCVAE